MLSLDLISSSASCGITALAGARLLRPSQGYGEAFNPVPHISRDASLLMGSRRPVRPEAGEPTELALSRADGALYRARSGGRHQVLVGAVP